MLETNNELEKALQVIKENKEKKLKEFKKK